MYSELFFRFGMRVFSLRGAVMLMKGVRSRVMCACIFRVYVKRGRLSEWGGGVICLYILRSLCVLGR